MKTALQIDLTFEQIIYLVKQLPKQQKIRLLQELEKDGYSGKIILSSKNL